MCEEIRSFLRIWSHLLKKPFMENFNVFCSLKTAIPSWRYMFHSSKTEVLLVNGDNTFNSLNKESLSQRSF